MFLALFIFYFFPALGFLNKKSKNLIFYLLTLSPLITSIFSLIFLFLNFFNFWLIFSFDLILSIYGIIKIKFFKISFKEIFFPIFISAIVFPFFLIQGEPFEGASDAGVYTSSAINFLDKGRYFLNFEEHLSKEFKEISIKETNYQYNWKETYPGIIFLKDKFAPQFFPLYSIHLSIFYKIFKIKGFLFCNFWFFFLSVFVFYKLLNLFLPKFYSKISVILFSLNPGVIYFTKYPTAEIFLSFLILSFFLFFILSLRANKNFFFLLSSIFLSLSLTTKFLSYFLLGSLFLFYFFYKDNKKINKFLIYFSIFSIIPLISIFLYNYPYFLNHLLPIVRIKYILIIILFSILFLILKNFSFSKKILYILPFLFLAISIWATFLRPNKEEIFEENNLLEFSWYFGIISLNLSFLGCFFSFFKKRNLFFNLNYYLFLILAIFGTGDNPFHPFSFRRYIPLFLPLSSFYFSFLLKDFKIKKTFSIFVLILSLIFPLYKGENLILSKEGKGFLDLYFKAKEKNFPEGTLATSDTFYLSSQLNLIGGKKIYPLNLEDEKNLYNFQKFLKEKEKIYLFSSLKYNFQNVFEIDGNIEHLQMERNKIPKKIINFYPKFFLYEVSTENLKSYNYIKIGENDFGKISNFWDLEFDGEKYFKWTKRECFFYLKLKNDLFLLIDKGGNPEKEVPFRIYFENKLIFDGFAKDGWNLYRFNVPDFLKGKEGSFKFVTHSFQPLPDTRELGLKISEIFTN